ncbi:MAG TPA: hypothetical protein ENH81_06740 [Thermococcus sp.]|nr:hypothetical protein [Thermococcus sp.]
MIDQILNNPLVTKMGEVVLRKGFEKLTERMNVLDASFSGAFEILDRAMVINVLEKTQKYSFIGRLKTNRGRVKIPYTTTRAFIRPILSLDKIPVFEQKNGETILHLKNLKPKEDYIVELDLKIHDDKFVESLVYTKIPKEPEEDDHLKKYPISAQLTHLKYWENAFSRFELYGIDVKVDVAVHQEIKLKVPRQFEDYLRTIYKLASVPMDRTQQLRLVMKLSKQQHSKFGGKELDIIRELQQLFTPAKFSKYIEIKGEFRYDDVARGPDFNELPIPTWPKKMIVVSRTDLDLQTPAKRGEVLFKKKEFMEDIGDLFE